MKKSILKYFLIIMSLFLSACSGMKHLPEGGKLYTGAVVKMETSDDIGRKKKKQIKAAAKSVIRPEPNKSFLGMRPKLWRYMAAGDDPQSKFGKWLQRNGEAPVLMKSIRPRVTAEFIDAKLFNMGVFNVSTDYVTDEKKRKGKVVYTCNIHKPYTISEFTHAIPNVNLSLVLLYEKEKSFIQLGDDYNLESLLNERIRLDALLKNNGYFYFSPDYLIFKADTSTTDYAVSLRLTLKEDILENAQTIYRINSVYINQNYSLREELAENPEDTIMYQDIVFRGTASEMNIRPQVISKSVFLKKGDVYSRLKHSITLNRLMSMGNYKFVQLKFTESDSIRPGFLDAVILMTSTTNYSFRAEMDIVSKSNNYTGPRMSISLLNRNTFGGAELLNLNLAGSYEMQLSGKNKNLYAYSLSPRVELTFPSIISPFKIRLRNSIYMPRTYVSVSYNYLNRVNYFDMRTVQSEFGYRWKNDILKDHEFRPLNLSYTTIGNKSDEFIELLESNPFLKKSYEEQFIAGGSYTFTYNEQVLPLKKIQYFLLSTFEIAGNVFSLGNLIVGKTPSPENPARVIGSVYSQYAKLSMDARAYYNFRDKNKLALRVFTGVAKPYQNSLILPYSKQFFSGGSNSIRAFQINSVGPGTHHQDNDNKGFLQLGGDIKLELNAEYRFNMTRYFKGALFIDGGNVWLQKNNPAEIGSPFMFSTFMNELAVGAGIGLRIDVSFFLLRFDLAMPLRKPWLPENNRWVTNQISFGNPSWRRDNLILNVAIGYPF